MALETKLDDLIFRLGNTFDPVRQRVIQAEILSVRRQIAETRALLKMSR